MCNLKKNISHNYQILELSFLWPVSVTTYFIIIKFNKKNQGKTFKKWKKKLFQHLCIKINQLQALYI